MIPVGTPVIYKKPTDPPLDCSGHCGYVIEHVGDELVVEFLLGVDIHGPAVKWLCDSRDPKNFVEIPRELVEEHAALRVGTREQTRVREKIADYLRNRKQFA